MNNTIKNDDAILTVTGLKTYFPVRGGLWRKKKFVKAVDGVDLVVARGRTLALVGESGSGKTTVGRTILRLIEPTAGSVVLDGQEIFSLPSRRLRRLRPRMQIIFQDPVGSLNPRMTIGNIIAEPLKVHRMGKSAWRAHRTGELLEKVGLSPTYAGRYPHEFSGGQRQRIGIARALACQPDFIVCDEPVSALDVSIQAQILNLLSDLQDELGLSYLFIAHNLAVVEHFANSVAVMYLGRIVEYADRDRLYNSPLHPYTESLLSAAPRIEPNPRRERIALAGEMPSPINPPSGCAFHTRCPLTRRLAQNMPESETVTIPGQDGDIRIVKQCTRQTPILQPTDSDPSHLQACMMR